MSETRRGDEERFDPSRYPHAFTRDNLRQLSLRELLLLEEHVEELTPRQRETFMRSRRELFAPMASMTDDTLAKLARITMPKAFATTDAVRTLAKLNERSSRQAALIRHIQALPTTASRIEGAARVPEEQAGAGAATTTPTDATVNVGLATSTAAGFSPSVTVDELEREVESDADLITVMTSMLDLMQKQHLSSTRAAFFVVIVSMSAVVAGVASVISIPDGPDRLWVLCISAALGVFALAFYLLVRWRQTRTDTPTPTPGS